MFFWSVVNVGTIRWSEIKIGDYRGVMKEAKTFGLKYGVVSSRNDNGRHSTLSVARRDREYTDEELRECDALLDQALAEVETATLLKPTEREELRHLTEGLTLEESAKNSGVAISTVKNRPNQARLALDAKTSTLAVAEAIKRKLL